MSARTVLRRFVHGATWKNPVISAVVHASDPIDLVALWMGGRSYLPIWSTRVRASGPDPDLGGKRFVNGGRTTRELLEKYAGVEPQSRVLEIGCSCGRNAFALAELLDHGNYTGMDIDRVALRAARRNRLLTRKGFAFDLIDIRSDVYNPSGRFSAVNYRLPYPDGSFDVVFMISVFTHMVTDEVRNYARQIARVLRPGGRCLLTTFLLDRPMRRQFPFRMQEHSIQSQEFPSLAVAYRLQFLSSVFAENGMTIAGGPLWGKVHGDGALTPEVQDVLVFAK